MTARVGTLEGVIDRFMERIERDYAEACVHMDPLQLTDRQKFAVALLHGVPMGESRIEKGRLVLTLEPCGIAVQDGHYSVYWRSAAARERSNI